MVERLLKPLELVEQLNETVIGQEHAKKVLALAVYKHYLRQTHKDSTVKMEKSNLLFLGPTGSGKTFLVQTIAKLINVPFITVDATAFTPAGYRGTDLSQIVKRLYKEAGDNVEATKSGIIFLDEFDKLASPKEASGNFRNYSVGIQNGYLKMLEGLDVPVSSFLSSISVDTSEILFICGGAFTGLDQIIERRLNGTPEVDGRKDEAACNFDRVRGAEKKDVFVAGFGRPLERTADGYSEKADKSILKNVTLDDLIEFGFIPELLGRLQHKVVLDGLDEDALVAILTKPKYAVLKQFRQEFLFAGTDLFFTADALHAVARKALEKGTGARGLRSILDELLCETQFEALSNDHAGETIVVDADTVAGKYAPRFTRDHMDFQIGMGDAGP